MLELIHKKKEKILSGFVTKENDDGLEFIQIGYKTSIFFVVFHLFYNHMRVWFMLIFYVLNLLFSII